MNPIPTDSPRNRSGKRGIALVTVLAVLSLAAVLILSFFSIAQNELKSAQTYSDGLEAQQLSQTAINLVMHQIRSASSGKNIAWASQPGALRTFGSGTDPGTIYKMYSDEELKGAPSTLTNDASDMANWDAPQNRAIYTDLNEGVVRPHPNGIRQHFPIVDPAAGDETTEGGAVEGFEYDVNTVGRGVTGEGLPMPVKWIYQLEDGTLGTLTGIGTFQSLTGSSIQPSKINPIVGRVAYWTDDESSKVNINTAAGGRSWDTPRAGGLTDHNYGRNQPVQREFQRYPGHPSQTSLQPVLFPDKRQQFQLGFNKEVMEEIYKITPRVVGGGSEAGTRAVLAADLEPLTIDRDRLFATVDEMLFRAPNLNGEGDVSGAMQLPREENDRQFFQVDPERLEKVRFFLTANSRSPETTLFNTPRVSVWPSYELDVSSEEIVQHSAFDRRIRFCAELGGKKYHFQRKESHSQSADFDTIERNRELYSYLQEMTSQTIPGVGGDFKTKYGADTDQILTQIFDYIRSVNLADDSLLDENNIGENGRFAWGNNPDDHVSYTNYRVAWRDGEFSHPGHGQVTPIRIGQTKGFGRAYSFMEVGFGVICTADGSAHSTSIGNGRIGGQRRRLHEIKGDEWSRPDSDQIRGSATGTLEERMTFYKDKLREDELWAYSNIPPLSGIVGAYGPLGQIAVNYGAAQPYELLHFNNAPLLPAVYSALKVQVENIYRAAGKLGLTEEMDHAEFIRVVLPKNWNHTLDTATPLRNDERRVQAVMLFQLFCPSKGWTEINADFKLEVDISGEWKLDNKDFGWNGTNLTLRTPGPSARHVWGSRQNGGVLEARSLLMGAADHRNPGASWIPRYATATTANLADNPSRDEFPGVVGNGRDPSTEEGESSYPFVSVPMTVKVNNSDPKMLFRGGSIDARIFNDDGARSDSEKEDDPSQELRLRFDHATLPVPVLASGMRGEYRNEDYGESNVPVADTQMQPYEMWTLNRDGAFKYGDRRERGRMYYAVNRRPSLRGGFIYFDSGNRLIESGFAGDVNALDVVRSYVVPHGDIRLTHVKADLDDSDLVPHEDYEKTNVYVASNFSYGNSSSGYGQGGADKKLVPAGTYGGGRRPFLPDNYNEENLWGDFDNSIANEIDGPFINKPDEGNSRGVTKLDHNPGGLGAVDREHIPYFNEPWVQEPSGPGYFSPNRIMPSAGMFGSLPTGVKAGDPWQTLLFRPQTTSSGSQDHPGTESPEDHLFLDFFWMPVVEPWSISDPLATAGKINLNYQIVPFTHIRRDTGLRAVFASEEMLTIPNELGNSYNSGRGYGRGYNHKYDTGGFLRNKSLRSVINANETLRQWDEKFALNDVFRSASELCEMHLVPIPIRGIQLAGEAEPKLEDMEDMYSMTDEEGLGIVGDNSRERPYSNLINRVTTKSNTYQVHYRAQILKQSPVSPTSPGQRRTDAEYATFDPDFDTVVSEYRGSTIIERYVDPNDPRIPDYAADFSGAEPLGNYYRFRVVSNRRFAP